MQQTLPEAKGGFSRDLDILNELAEASAHTREGLRLTDLAAATGREKSQLSRALARLERTGLVTRDDASRRYVLGWRLYHLAALTAETRLLGLAQPAMRRIVIEIGETVHLCVLRGTSTVTVHSELPRHGYRGLSWVGLDTPAHTLTAGRVLLAAWTDDDLRAAYPREQLRDVPATGKIRTRSELLSECATIRARGYALVDEEFESGLVGASAAVHDFRGIAVASLNIAAPKSRLATKLRSAGEYIVQVADRLSASLGWLPASRP